MKFVETIHCTSRIHCKGCRNLVTGRDFRKKLSEFYELPNNDIDFECPFGIPWNKQEPQIFKTDQKANLPIHKGCGGCGKNISKR